MENMRFLGKKWLANLRVLYYVAVKQPYRNASNKPSLLLNARPSNKRPLPARAFIRSITVFLSTVSTSKDEILGRIRSGGSRGYASSKKEGENVIKRSLGDSIFLN